ncbi:putative metallo-beta-lactamase [Lupinus albus]|uniref:Putative metallo-beta-lactamase n=1 Tax=Lupinus albus TaxID=3870 RepID=A0A6A4PVH0_LUPAL|nr:putative metallo-beta-lactamase [Lupinus albus]
MTIETLVLGAGQEVGKSCVVVTINGKRIMFDCGMHMGETDHRRYPDFQRISDSGDFNNALSCVIITHFHLDHVGALPYFTEVCGYSGPIYMTYPTKALSPLMLEDYRKVMVDRRGEEEQFTSDHIVECMKKVIALDLRQTVQVDEDLQIRAYYAGHVIGAAMFYAKVGDTEMVYTGDYNMTPDRHLGAAQIDRLRLDLLITESTYATTIRDSRYAREREFLKAVHKCVSSGGKVLIPTFALGRAQELCILLDDYWERMNLKVPIYFSSGLNHFLFNI